jgi:hypothetical protein
MLGIAVAIMVRSRETRKTERIREVRIARRRMPWGVGGRVGGEFHCVVGLLFAFVEARHGIIT